MHGGIMIQLRQSIAHARYAKPWQQALICAGLILGGAALLLTGAFIGLVPAALGLLFIAQNVSSHLRRRRARRSHRP